MCTNVCWLLKGVNPFSFELSFCREMRGSSHLAQKHITLVMSKEQTKMHQYILESPVSTPLSNQQTCVHIELLFLIENLSYTYRWSSLKGFTSLLGLKKFPRRQKDKKILNKLSCFQSKHTFWEVREHLFCLKYRCQRVYVCRQHVKENDFFTVAQCSQRVLCIVQERPKIISSS